jgi:hypothetical protein
MCMKMDKEKSFFFNIWLQMKKIVFDQYLWIKGTHQNSGHPHQNNILTMIDRLLEFKWASTSKYWVKKWNINHVG